jgi:glucose-1-phosphate cytidylyltransferase
MKHYSIYGFNEFYLALGYKGEQIKRYFMDYHSLARNFTVSLADGQTKTINQTNHEPWIVHLVDTDIPTGTGGRLKKLEPFLKNGTFMMTYGDGVSNLDLNQLLAFHRDQGGLVTLTAVRPPARYGAIKFEGKKVTHFKEKSTVEVGWINGGFFVIEPQALDYITQDVMWEHAPMERLAKNGQLFAYEHHGFWQCVDTMRELKYLESLWETGKAPWKLWEG